MFFFSSRRRLTSLRRDWFRRVLFRSLDRSPISLVGNVTTPTMLMTGENDHRTPITQSEEFYQALKLRGIDTALVRIPGASHAIVKRPSNMVNKVTCILSWFEKYGPGAGNKKD